MIVLGRKVVTFDLSRIKTLGVRRVRVRLKPNSRVKGDLGSQEKGTTGKGEVIRQKVFLRTKFSFVFVLRVCMYRVHFYLCQITGWVCHKQFWWISSFRECLKKIFMVMDPKIGLIIFTCDPHLGFTPLKRLSRGPLRENNKIKISLFFRIPFRP